MNASQEFELNITLRILDSKLQTLKNNLEDYEQALRKQKLRLKEVF